MSTRTTYLGPEVSFRTSASQSATPVHVLFPSDGTVAIAGKQLLSNATSGSLTSATLVDGEFRIGALSVSSCVLYYRSGVTTYRFIADAGAVL